LGVGLLSKKIMPPLLTILRRVRRDEQRHALRMCRFQVFLAQVPAVQQVLFHLPARALFHLLPQRRAQSSRVRTFRAHLHPHNGATLRVRRQLHIHRRVVAPIGHLHDARFRIRRAHPRGLRHNLLAPFSPRPLHPGGVPALQLRQLRNRLLQALLPLLRRPLPRRRLPRAPPRSFRRLQLPSQLRHVPFRFPQQFLQPPFPPKTLLPRPHPHPHSVLADAADLHHPFIHQS